MELARAASFAMLLVATNSLAIAATAYVSGNDLYAECSANTQLCLGFVEAVADSFTSYEPSLLCLPGTVTNGQLVDIVAKFLRDNPEERHRTAYMLVAQAIGAAFPCPKG